MKQKLFILFLTFTASIALWAAESGTCGANLTWTLDDEGTLTISGTGEMAYYGYGGAPWLAYSESIKEVVIESGVTNIGGMYAFAYCDNLTLVTISETVSSIGEYTFQSCNSLSAFHVNASNTALCDVDGVLFNKEKTILIKYPAAKTGDTYSVPNTVTCIDGIAFSHCVNLTSVTIPNGVTEILLGAFEWCRSLTSITLPNTLKIIGRYAFEYSGIESINIPASVTSIGEMAFRDCNYLAAINVDANNPYYSSVDGVLFNKNKTTLLRYPIGKQGEYIIPNGVTRIEEMAFEMCGRLTSITIPEGVTYIGRSAFWKCRSLEEIIIPDGVKEIGENAFYGCTGLTSVQISESVTKIGNDAFDGCDNLPVIDNIRYADTYLIEVVDKSLTTYTIKNGTRFIGSSAFYGCTNMTNIRLPESIISIGFGAFDDCTSLPVIDNIRYADWYLAETVDKTQPAYTIKEGTKWIGYGAFMDCKKVTSIVIPEGVKWIGNAAFYGCPLLQTVNIPKTVEHIDLGDDEYFIPYTFMTNVGEEGLVEGALTAINVAPENPNYASMDGVLFNKDKSTLLAYPSGKKGAYVVPEAVTTIGGGAFMYNIVLTEITIPNSVTNIGMNSFTACENLEIVSLGKSIETIEGNAFAYCESITDIYCYAERIPEAHESAFDGVSREAHLWVPADRVLEYQIHDLWGEFDVRALEESDSSIEHVATSSQPAITNKLILDGQLFLLRDGKIYTVQGHELK